MNAPAIIQAARLPETYENARIALSECQQVDECKDWADKAAALASYARQSEDDQLERMAQRIRARAIRRAGELAKQLMTPHGGNRTEQVDTSDNLISRDQVKERSGFSDRQLTTALRVANVPERDFEEQVEGPKPPTLSQLASQGIQRRDPPDPQSWLKGRDSKAFNRALHFTGDITEYAKTARKWDLSVLDHLDDEQRAEIRNALRLIDSIHDAIATRI